ncbi:MAG TPA: DUF488 domain-containing protein [Ktedonobacterales bacterium]|jgi:uncharacterized protein (DUF488 family)
MVLYTIGFTRKSLREFITLLREAGVDGVVDIRLNNTSQLAGYAKRDDLAFVLETFGIGYLEEPGLAPTPTLLDTYRRDHDWAAYEPVFRGLLAERPVAEILADITARFERPCLLCAEPEPTHCHRRLVAEAFSQLRPRLEVRHLVLAPPSRVRSAPRSAATSAAPTTSRKGET